VQGITAKIATINKSASFLMKRGALHFALKTANPNADRGLAHLATQTPVESRV
jgi:hypothetical protein